jgi:hypothetical protein
MGADMLVCARAHPYQRTATTQLWHCDARSRSVFGDLVLVAFLLSQVLDGALTYVGITVFGPEMEGNPLLGWLMLTLGEGPALAGAKVVAGICGIVLHLIAVHRVVAILTAVYVAAAILPWTIILYLS